MHILLYTRLISSTPPSTRPSLAPVCTTCRTCPIPVMRWWMFSFSAWTGTYPLASPVLHCQSFLNCTRRQLISWTFSSATCPTRSANRPSGISKRPTAYYTRSARLCCGAIWITAHAKLCGVGVSAVQWNNVCPMLPFQHAKETFSWLRSQGISIYIHIGRI